MTKQAIAENIVRVKLALAEKYERRSRSVRSKPNRLRLLRHAERFRQQAANVAQRGRA